MIATKLQIAAVFVGICLFCLMQKCHGVKITSCQMVDSCSCRVETGELIDLHWAHNSQDGKPVFHYYGGDKQQFDYTYSPCAGFPCESLSQNSSLCLEPSITTHAANLGNISTARFEVNSSNITLVYVANGSSSVNVTSRVRLQCSENVEKFELTANTSALYIFTLTSPCACPGVCKKPNAKAGTNMSTGTILVLIFFTFLALYFGIGCLYNKAVQGGNCAEMIPHREFWCSLPSLIRDGYIFFISPCLGNRTEYRTYDKL